MNNASSDGSFLGFRGPKKVLKNKEWTNYFGLPPNILDGLGKKLWFQKKSLITCDLTGRTLCHRPGTCAGVLWCGSWCVWTTRRSSWTSCRKWQSGTRRDAGSHATWCETSSETFCRTHGCSLKNMSEFQSEVHLQYISLRRILQIAFNYIWMYINSKSRSFT